MDARGTMTAEKHLNPSVPATVPTQADRRSLARLTCGMFAYPHYDCLEPLTLVLDVEALQEDTTIGPYAQLVLSNPTDLLDFDIVIAPVEGLFRGAACFFHITIPPASYPFRGPIIKLRTCP